MMFFCLVPVFFVVIMCCDYIATASVISLRRCVYSDHVGVGFVCFSDIYTLIHVLQLLLHTHVTGIGFIHLSCRNCDIHLTGRLIFTFSVLVE